MNIFINIIFSHIYWLNKLILNVLQVTQVQVQNKLMYENFMENFNIKLQIHKTKRNSGHYDYEGTYLILRILKLIIF